MSKTILYLRFCCCLEIKNGAWVSPFGMQSSTKSAFSVSYPQLLLDMVILLSRSLWLLFLERINSSLLKKQTQLTSYFLCSGRGTMGFKPTFKP